MVFEHSMCNESGRFIDFVVVILSKFREVKGKNFKFWKQTKYNNRAGTEAVGYQIVNGILRSQSNVLMEEFNV